MRHDHGSRPGSRQCVRVSQRLELKEIDVLRVGEPANLAPNILAPVTGNRIRKWRRQVCRDPDVESGALLVRGGFAANPYSDPVLRVERTGNLLGLHFLGAPTDICDLVSTSQRQHEVERPEPVSALRRVAQAFVDDYDLQNCSDSGAERRKVRLQLIGRSRDAPRVLRGNAHRVTTQSTSTGQNQVLQCVACPEPLPSTDESLA